MFLQLLFLIKVTYIKKRSLTNLKNSNLFERNGYTVLSMSLAQHTGIDEVKNLLKNKTTLLSGHSGVGKSSFINIVFPELLLKTQNVSDWSGNCLHTTTFAEMFDLPGGGKIIDTPGLREFALM